MPLNDIVIDTNILMHANNHEAISQGECIKVINYLLTSSELICVDTAVDVNRSFILNEYFSNLRTPGTAGRAFIEQMLKTGRFKAVSKSAGSRATGLINRTMNNNKQTDKTFLKVTYNSIDKTFVTEDFEDFTQDKRNMYADELEITLLTAHEAIF